MHIVRRELNKYGERRLRKIVGFIRYGGRGGQSIMEGNRFAINVANLVTKTDIINAIVSCGIFEFLEMKFTSSWDRLISELAVDPELVYGFCNLFGLETEKIFRSTSNPKLAAVIILQKLINKLSSIFIFPGDPPMARCRKRLNDIRLNTISKSNIFGRDPMAIAREITTFHDAIHDPILRIIFWSNYQPGTGRFKVSVSNLDQVIDQNEFCPICLETLDESLPGIRVKPCNHVFHPKCIQALLLAVDRTVPCPMCRIEIEDFENKKGWQER